MMKEITVEIFDPPMCCPTGLCGPDVDPALLAIQEALLKIKSKWPGVVQVERYALSQQPGRFVKNQNIMALLESHGTSALPIIVVNGEITQHGAYPEYEELERIITQLQVGAIRANE